MRTWQGFCYTAFVTDVCTRKIVVLNRPGESGDSLI
ncbi:hypothetical protein [Mycobacterium tuberculosis]